MSTTTAPFCEGDLLEIQDATTGTWTTASVLDCKRATTSLFGLCWEGHAQTTSGTLVRFAVNDDGVSRQHARGVRPAPAEAAFDWVWAHDDVLMLVETK